MPAKKKEEQPIEEPVQEEVKEIPPFLIASLRVQKIDTDPTEYKKYGATFETDIEVSVPIPSSMVLDVNPEDQSVVKINSEGLSYLYNFLAHACQRAMEDQEKFNRWKIGI